MNLRKLIFPASEKTVSVEFLRSVLVAGVPYEAGSVASFDSATAKALCENGAAFDPLAEGEATERQRGLAALLPPPGEPKVLPDSWQSLPDCFKKWWALNEQGMLIVNRAEEIERRTSAKIKRYVPDFDVRSLKEIPDRNQQSALLNRVAVGMHIEIGDAPEAYQSECRYLKDASVRANKLVAEWREKNGPAVTALRFHCSEATITAHSELAKTSRELSFTGRSLFATRIAALGLHESKISELFHGSADFQKYNALAEVPALQDLRQAWHLDSGRDQAVYLDRPVPTMAQHWSEWTARNTELQALLKKAQAELKKAQGAMASAA